MSTRKPPLARRFIAALLMVLLTACHSWRPTTVSPQQLIPEEQPSLVRVTLIDGETVTVRDPTMRNDSIVGVRDADEALMTSPVGVASRDVRLLEVRRLSVTKNIVLAVPLILVAAAIIFVITCEEGCLSPGGEWSATDGHPHRSEVAVFSVWGRRGS